MGAAAEAVDAEPATGLQAATTQRPEADDARAQQRREGVIVIPVRQPVRVPGIDHDVLRVAAVGVPSGVLRCGAEVLGAAQAEPAATAGVPQPGNPSAVAGAEGGHSVTSGGHHTDHLVSRCHTATVHRKVALRDVQVGPAHTADVDLDQDFVLTRLGDGPLDPDQPMPTDRAGFRHGPAPHRAFDAHRPSLATPPPGCSRCPEPGDQRRSGDESVPQMRSAPARPPAQRIRQCDEPATASDHPCGPETVAGPGEAGCLGPVVSHRAARLPAVLGRHRISGGRRVPCRPGSR